LIAPFLLPFDRLLALCLLALVIVSTAPFPLVVIDCLLHVGLLLPLACAPRVQELSALACYKILSQISDEDCIAMGFDTRFTRPDWMLVSILPVPPPPVRPSVMMDSSAR
jgi:DNA-directed RNA polymerase beta' subunit